MQTIGIVFSCSVLAVFLLGIVASRYSQKTSEDFFLANRSLGSWVVGLSSGASTLSGFTFMGISGATAIFGVFSLGLWWISVVAFALAFWTFGPKMRELSAKHQSLSLTELSLQGIEKPSLYVRKLLGFVILTFTIIYAAAQLKAGGKAFHAVFGLPLELGICFAAVTVIFYSMSGGIRASIWTDVMQSGFMVVALAILLTESLAALNGFAGLSAGLKQSAPQLLQWWPEHLEKQPGVLLLGGFFASMGVIGQPHVLIRLFTTRSVNEARKAVIPYTLLTLTVGTFSILVGLCGQVLVKSQATQVDSELTLPFLALQNLSPFLAGLFLAGLFSSTMSTLDSQMLVAASSLARELIPKWRADIKRIKASVLLVTGFTTAVALYAKSNIFYLSIFAWNIMAGVTLPFVIVQISGSRFQSSKVASFLIISVLVTEFLVHKYTTVINTEDILYLYVTAGAITSVAFIARSKKYRLQFRATDIKPQN